jgi:hypothetical protein
MISTEGDMEAAKPDPNKLGGWKLDYMLRMKQRRGRAPRSTVSRAWEIGRGFAPPFLSDLKVRPPKTHARRGFERVVGGGACEARVKSLLV